MKTEIMVWHMNKLEVYPFFYSKKWIELIYDLPTGKEY